MNAKIIPHIWFDKEAKEAATLYTSLFPKSKITDTIVVTGMPSGDCEVVNFELWGYPFTAMSAGPRFKPNPSISFMVNFDPSQDKDALSRIDEVWEALLSDGGKALMPIDKYPFSERFGWVEDRYGVSWQLIFTSPYGDERPLVIPSFLFTRDVCDKAEEASNFYLSVFRDGKRGSIVRYGADQPPEKEGTIMFTDFKISEHWFIAMDSANAHNFSFNEAVSFVVNCDNQDEIDYYWDKLSAVPEAEQCGWLKDKYGVSWQIVPKILNDLLGDDDERKSARVTQALLKMKKLDIATLEAAAESLGQ